MTEISNTAKNCEKNELSHINPLQAEFSQSDSYVQRSCSDQKEPLVSTELNKSLITSSGYSTLTQGVSQNSSMKELSVNFDPTLLQTCCKQQNKYHVKKCSVQDEEKCRIKNKKAGDLMLNDTEDFKCQNTLPIVRYLENEQPKKSTSLTSLSKYQGNTNVKKNCHFTFIKSATNSTSSLEMACHEEKFAHLQFDAESSSKMASNFLPISPSSTPLNLICHEGNDEQCEQIASDSETDAISSDISKMRSNSNEKFKESTAGDDEPQFYDVSLEDEEELFLEHDKSYILWRKLKPNFSQHNDSIELPLLETRRPEMSNIQFSSLIAEVDEAVQANSIEHTWILSDYEMKNLKYFKRKKRITSFKKKVKKSMFNTVQGFTTFYKESSKSMYPTFNLAPNPVPTVCVALKLILV